MSTMPNPFQPARLNPLDYGQNLDAGVIARFFNAVYAWMAAGLGLTAAIAWWVSTQPGLLQKVLHGPVLIVLFIGQLALVWMIGNSIQRIGTLTATILFMVYAGLNGVLLSVIFLLYAHALIATAFFVTAAMFGATSLC